MMQEDKFFSELREVVAALRAPDGCPWDREQTFQSMKPCMINEMTEALAAIDIYEETEQAENLCEELGDVLLQVMLLSQMAQEKGLFSVEDVVRGITRKMIRRHPHVFGEQAAADALAGNVNSGIYITDKVQSEETDMGVKTAVILAAEVPGRWEAIKRAEKAGRTEEMKQREKEAFKVSAREVIGHLNTKLQK